MRPGGGGAPDPSLRPVTYVAAQLEVLDGLLPVPSEAVDHTGGQSWGGVGGD